MNHETTILLSKFCFVAFNDVPYTKLFEKFK
jgi:hypothetical protein